MNLLLNEIINFDVFPYAVIGALIMVGLIYSFKVFYLENRLTNIEKELSNINVILATLDKQIKELKQQ